jgi:hypothetical protein
MDSSKYCPECGEIVEGRRDKVFCNSSCKSKYFRRPTEDQDEEDTTTSSALLYSATIKNKPLSLPDESDEEESYWDKKIREREARVVEERLEQAQKRAKTLHQLYCRLTEQFLLSEGQPIYSEALTTYLRELDETTQEYREHIGLAQADDIGHLRLADLYWIRDTLRDVLDAIAQQGRFGRKWSSFELSKKRRNRLRLHLIP